MVVATTVLSPRPPVVSPPPHDGIDGGLEAAAEHHHHGSARLDSCAATAEAAAAERGVPHRADLLLGDGRPLRPRAHRARGRPAARARRPRALHATLVGARGDHDGRALRRLSGGRGLRGVGQRRVRSVRRVDRLVVLVVQRRHRQRGLPDPLPLLSRGAGSYRSSCSRARSLNAQTQLHTMERAELTPDSGARHSSSPKCTEHTRRAAALSRTRAVARIRASPHSTVPTSRRFPPSVGRPRPLASWLASLPKRRSPATARGARSRAARS